MTFSTGQIKNLNAKLSGRVVKTREFEGKELSYLEGWHVIAEANRIFGFDAWDRHTVSNKCIWEGMRRGCPAFAYVAKVRITVRAGPLRIVREGSGTGQGSAISPAEAHDVALKTAETDATKRAFATFGNPFGLALYDKDQAGVRKVRSTPCRKARPNGGDTQTSNSNGEEPSPKTEVNANGKYAVTRSGQPDEPGIETNVGAQTNGAGPNAAGGGYDQAASINGDVLPARQRAPDKSTLTIAEPRRIFRPEHLRFVASRPCLICGNRPSEAHHLTFAQPRGLGIKSSDEYTVPLCRAHHRQLHSGGDEEAWWSKRGVDALGLAAEMWDQTNRQRSQFTPRQ